MGNRKMSPHSNVGGGGSEERLNAVGTAGEKWFNGEVGTLDPGDTTGKPSPKLKGGSPSADIRLPPLITKEMQ